MNWAVGGLTILTVFFTIWEIIAYPYLIHKSWRYEVDEEFVQIKYGIFVVRHQIVPMTKVQSVQLKQGPIMRKYHLYTIEIGTMGTSHKSSAAKS